MYPAGMARKRGHHLQERDESLYKARPLGTGTVERPPPANVSDHLLSMQQSYGNAAVTHMVVQRRDKAASTDAPWMKKKPPKTVKDVKKEEPTEDFAPTSANPKFSTWETSDLLLRAQTEAESSVRNSLYFAAELMEEHWFRLKYRPVGLGLYRVYKKLGDAKRAAFWIGVLKGTIKPGMPKSADEDMSDKHF